MESIKLENGKYEFLYSPGHLTCLRNSEPWRDFIGDKAVYSLFAFAQAMTRAHKVQQNKIDGLRIALSAAQSVIQKNHDIGLTYDNYDHTSDREVAADIGDHKSDLCILNEMAIKNIKEILEMV